MRRYILYLIMIVSSINSYSFKIDSVDFDKIVFKGKISSKKYKILNNSNDIKSYKVEIEEDYPNITISPSNFILKPNEEKSMELFIKGQGKIGENNYFLVFSETNLSAKRENKAVINKRIRLKQKYIY